MPRLSGCRSKQHQNRLWKRLEIIISMYCRAGVERNLSEHLHANDGIDKEQHYNQQRYIGQCLERLDERPQQRSYAFASTQQLYQTHHAKQSKEIDRNDAGSTFSTTFVHIHFRINDVNEAAQHNDEIEHVPGVAKVILEPKRGQFEDKLQRKDGRKDEIQQVECLCVEIGLPIEFHGQRHRIDHDQNENGVLKRLGRNEPPDLVLDPMLRYVPSYRLCFQRKLDAVPLVFVELTILIFLFAFILKSHNNETDENVDHKESDYNDVDDVVGGYNRTEVMNGSTIFGL